MARYGGYRIPESYSPDWEKHGMPEYYQWWHLGYEDGVWQTKWEYGIPDEDTETGKETISQIEKLEQENRALKALIGANVRVIKEELRKENQNES